MISTGIPSLDEATGGGLPIRMLTTILGGPKVGKSEIARQFRRAAIANGVPVLHIDVELGPARLRERDICQLGHINAFHYRRELFTKEELMAFRQAEAQLEAEEFVYMLSGGNMTPLPVLTQQIEAALAELPAGKPVLLIIDSAQRMALGNPDCQGTTRDKTQAFMLWAEQFAHTHDVAMLMTSEQSRTPPGVERRVEDAIATGAESRSIEYYSDLQLVAWPTGKMETIEAAQEHVRVLRLAITATRLGEIGWVKQDLCFHYPWWGFSLRAHDSPHATAEDVDRDYAKLQVGIKYSNSDLQQLWGCGAMKVRSVVGALIERGEVRKIGRCYALAHVAEVEQ